MALLLHRRRFVHSLDSPALAMRRGYPSLNASRQIVPAQTGRGPAGFELPGFLGNAKWLDLFYTSLDSGRFPEGETCAVGAKIGQRKVDTVRDVFKSIEIAQLSIAENCFGCKSCTLKRARV